MGVVRGCRAFTPLFKTQEGGQFVNIASMAGLLNPPAMSKTYVAQAGVVALSETLAAELDPWNSRTLVVCPSYFQTNLNESLRTSDEATRAALPKLLASSELSADDIAEGIVQAVERGDTMFLPHPRARDAYALKQADPEAFREAEQICQRELGKLVSKTSMSARVRRVMLEKQHSFPSLNVAARLFHLTPRTLHRRLLEEGTSYKQILEEVRHTLAVEHLKAGRLTVEEIAYSLGYTDLANFRRAFKRWEGMPPSAFREREAR
jgi:AraC-like DNA-binding protein